MKTNMNPPEKPWEILTVKDHGPGTWYRYSVTGLNHNYDPPASLSWAVPSLDDPQFDTSNAVKA